MAQTAWMRFTGADKTILGIVFVPKIVPDWLVTRLKEMSVGNPRNLTIDDLSPRQYVDELCARNSPIPLRKPLLTKLVAEDLYVLNEEANKAMTEDGGFDASKITQTYTTSDLARLQDAGKLDQIGNLVKIPWEAMNRKPQQRIVHLPLIDPNSEKENTFAIFPASFMAFVELDDGKTVEQIADGVYGMLNQKKVQLLT
jgi:hypothetical protein